MLTFKKPTAEQFFKVFNIEDFSVSPDESQLVFSTNLTGYYNIWAMDLPNNYPYPLTFNNQSCHGIKYEPNGKYIMASFDHDGNELTQLYALPTSGGDLSDIRVDKDHRHMVARFSKDGKRIFYTGTKDNKTFLNTFSYDIEKGEEKLIVEGKDASTYLLDVSEDEKSFIFLKQFSNTYTLAYLLENGKEVQLTPPTDKQHTVNGPVFTDENTIYLLTDYEDDSTYVARYDIPSGSFERVSNGDLHFSELYFNKNSNKLYIVSSKGVEDTLYTYSLESNELTELDAPVSIIDKLIISKKGTVYLLGKTAIKPANIYKLEDGNWSCLTNNRVPAVSDEDLSDPEILTYPSFDGLEIESLFFKAKEEVSNGHVILWPHGGPQASERKFFRSYFQFLINRGFSIFAPNFRGSSNYGLSYMKMVEGDWGYGPRLDNITGLDWLIEKGYAEKDKIFLMGGSYGGYMALLLHGRHPEYFKAVIDIFGVSNLFSFIESVPEHWKPVMKQWVGDPVEDKEKLTEFSPITYLDTMTKPMLIIQGANDPRVVKHESDQIVEALQAKGRDVEYIVLDDEGHGFSKKENEIKVFQAILDFIEKHT
ncbi:S9 family peptidase [Sutcliffiella rhizosphaerae]|uniref:Tol-Pal system protein TolB n=1 Tax=Sutcliffiella rhizosphaerae TaxID=2880967 RepID=A0ABM8YPF3_9BACI|nr:S9 family peptidase [Sutcliffiella rhizosphaerae]CAG9621896.1 Tol-Pal system protein TolB [Sutcliffiella rhizosphaerae]